jgi:hypothetical protein
MWGGWIKLLLVFTALGILTLISIGDLTTIAAGAILIRCKNTTSYRPGLFSQTQSPPTLTLVPYSIPFWRYKGIHVQNSNPNFSDSELSAIFSFPGLGTSKKKGLEKPYLFLATLVRWSMCATADRRTRNVPPHS